MTTPPIKHSLNVAPPLSGHAGFIRPQHSRVHLIPSRPESQPTVHQFRSWVAHQPQVLVQKLPPDPSLNGETEAKVPSAEATVLSCAVRSPPLAEGESPLLIPHFDRANPLVEDLPHFACRFPDPSESGSADDPPLFPTFPSWLSSEKGSLSASPNASFHSDFSERISYPSISGSTDDPPLFSKYPRTRSIKAVQPKKPSPISSKPLITQDIELNLRHEEQVVYFARTVMACAACPAEASSGK